MGTPPETPEQNAAGGHGSGQGGGDGQADSPSQGSGGNQGGGDVARQRAGSDPQQGDTFTQSDVDRIVADRLSKERGKYSDYSDLKAKARKYDEHQQANASELDKATQRADDAEARVKAANERAVGAEVRATAADGWADPGDAPLYLGDLSGYLNESGDVDTDRIKTDLDGVLEAKPHLKRSDAAPRTPRPDHSQGPREDQPPPLDQRVQSRLERIRADTGIS